MKCLARILLILIVLAVIILPRATVLADDSVDITVTAVPLWTAGILNFAITYVSDTQLDFDWGFAPGTTNIMIRAKYGNYPDDIPDEMTEPTDGYLIYYGNAVHASDTSVNFDESTGALYVKAWGKKADGNWHVNTSTGFEESAVLTLIGVLLFCGILSYLAIRSSFFGLKLVAGMAWIAFVVYWKSNPPTIVTEGSPEHTAIMIVAIGFALMIVLSGLGRGIQRTEKWGTGTQQSEGFHFKLPDWMNMSEDTPEERTRNTNEALDNYRETLRRAYRRKGYK